MSKRTWLGGSGDYSSAGSRESEEVAGPMSRDRAKAAARKEKAKGKTASSSDSSGAADMLKNLCSLSKGLVKAKLWKQ